MDKLTCLYKSGLALLLIPFFFACDDPSQLGLEVPDTDDRFNVQKAEFSLPVSTIYIDSLISGYSNFSTFGQYTDPVTGKVRATAYNLIGIDGGHLPDTTDTFLRAYMKLAVSENRMNSELVGEELHIHEAEDSLFTSAVYLSRNSIPYNSEPILSHTFDFDPTGTRPDSIITVDLSDELALKYYNQLYRAAIDGSGETLDSLRRNYFFRKPLVFVPGENNQGLYNFDVTSEYTGIYFEMENDAKDTVYTYKYKFRRHFSNLERDKTGSELQNLTEDYQENASTDTYSYSDVMAGVYTKVSLQPLLDFIEDQKLVTVNSSRIQLQATDPNQNFTSNIQAFNGFFVLGDGRINGPGGQAQDQNGSPNPAASRNAILRDESYFSAQPALLNITLDSTNLYRANMALFTQLLFDNHENDKEFITKEFVLVSPRSSTLNQTALINSEVKLTLYYTSLTE
ncbi:DUF4270 domain-containing protein [Marinoscillum pacificum]|uniref:DUF4270 domain-containing protein n=1 Tax=Marinoscillum pacificum TaxID=392723 RepID=UPI0021585963|nr:DUF4270 domain-containing protein [Marinoscillum pacificum]